jgi:hypothetical protein
LVYREDANRRLNRRDVGTKLILKETRKQENELPMVKILPEVSTSGECSGIIKWERKLINTQDKRKTFKIRTQFFIRGNEYDSKRKSIKNL